MIKPATTTPQTACREMASRRRFSNDVFRAWQDQMKSLRPNDPASAYKSAILDGLAAAGQVYSPLDLWIGRRLGVLIGLPGMDQQTLDDIYDIVRTARQGPWRRVLHEPMMLALARSPLIPQQLITDYFAGLWEIYSVTLSHLIINNPAVADHWKAVLVLSST